MVVNLVDMLDSLKVVMLEIHLVSLKVVMKVEWMVDSMVQLLVLHLVE